MEIYGTLLQITEGSPFLLSKADDLVSDFILSAEQVSVMMMSSSGEFSFDKMSLLTDSFRPLNKAPWEDPF